MLEALISAVLGALAKLLLDWLSQRRVDRAREDLGAARSESTLNRTVAEIADAQAANNDVDRGGADDVARRLRQRIANGAGNGR